MSNPSKHLLSETIVAVKQAKGRSIVHCKDQSLPFEPTNGESGGTPSPQPHHDFVCGARCALGIRRIWIHEHVDADVGIQVFSRERCVIVRWRYTITHAIGPVRVELEA